VDHHSVGVRGDVIDTFGDIPPPVGKLAVPPLRGAGGDDQKVAILLGSGLGAEECFAAASTRHGGEDRVATCFEFVEALGLPRLWPE